MQIVNFAGEIELDRCRRRHHTERIFYKTRTKIITRVENNGMIIFTVFFK